MMGKIQIEQPSRCVCEKEMKHRNPGAGRLGRDSPEAFSVQKLAS
jgi:hypothetical protein